MMSTILMEVILLASLSVDVSHLSRVSAGTSCYMDTCSIGNEYCDQIEGRCSSCSRDLCHLSYVPPACQQMCNVLQEERTKIRNDHEDECRPTTVSDNSTMSYVTAVNTSLILAISVAVSIYLIRQKKFRSNLPSNSRTILSSYPIKNLLNKSVDTHRRGDAVERIECLSPPGEETMVRTENQTNETRHLRLDFIPLAQGASPDTCVCQEESGIVSGQSQGQEECLQTGISPTLDTTRNDDLVESLDSETQNPAVNGQSQTASFNNSDQPNPVVLNEENQSPSLSGQYEAALPPGQFQATSQNRLGLPSMTYLGCQTGGSVDLTSPKVLDNWDSASDAENLETTYVKSPIEYGWQSTYSP